MKLEDRCEGTREPGARVRPRVELDAHGTLATATCTCRSFVAKELAQGPCEHTLGLRLAHLARLAEDELKGGGSAGT